MNDVLRGSRRCYQHGYAGNNVVSVEGTKRDLGHCTDYIATLYIMLVCVGVVCSLLC